MDEVIAAVEDAMRELGEGDAHNEPRRRAFAPGGILNVMFAAYPGGKCTGLKGYTVSNGHVRFMVAMFNLDCSLDALVEADFMGAYRTGAATAVAARALGTAVPARIGLIGTGWQAATQALALSRVVEIDELRVYSRNAEKRAMFAEEQGEQLGVQTVAADTAETAVRGADIVVTVTTSPAPVLEAEWVEPHAFVAAVGSNFRNRTEVPPELVERAHTVVVDQLAAAQLESGDLIQAAGRESSTGARLWSSAPWSRVVGSARSGRASRCSSHTGLRSGTWWRPRSWSRRPAGAAAMRRSSSSLRQVDLDRLRRQGADLQPRADQERGDEDDNQRGARGGVDDPRRGPGGGNTDHQFRPFRAAPGFPGFNLCPDHPAHISFGGRGRPSYGGFIFHVGHLHFSNARHRVADRSRSFCA